MKVRTCNQLHGCGFFVSALQAAWCPLVVSVAGEKDAYSPLDRRWERFARALRIVASSGFM